MALWMRKDSTIARFLIILVINHFISSIKKISKLAWRLILRRTLSREVAENDKATKLYTLVDARKTQIVLNGGVEGAKSYWTDLPLALKVSVPVTLFVWLFIGDKWAGIAAFGSARGVPVILLVFLGTTGIMAVIEAFVRHPNARPYLRVVLELIAHDEVLRQIKAAIKNGSQGAPKEPVRSKMPENEREIQEKLLAMDPYVFESHVMSFFRASGMIASVTQKSNDNGVDGFARHPEGLIVVQCKRYGLENLVGGPAAQQFWGVVLQHEAWRGYFVTTSQFTAGAVKTAVLSKKIVLVDMNEFVRWHQSTPRF